MSKQKILGYDIENEAEREKLTNYLASQMLEGKSAREALQVEDRDVEYLYAAAYAKYQAGDYFAAGSLFRFLVMMDANCYKFVLGLAASLHKGGEFAEARDWYLFAIVDRPRDPVAFFHGADCCFKLAQDEMGIQMLENAIECCGDSEEYAEMKGRAQLLLDGHTK